MNEEVLKCQYCQKEYKSKKRFIKHECLLKERYENKDNKLNQLAFLFFNNYFKRSFGTHIQKTYDDFVKSSLYIDFIKLGKYVIENKVFYPEKYLDFLINNKIKIKFWYKDSSYDHYILYILQNETLEEGITRTIKFMAIWAKKNNTTYTNFFKNATKPFIIHNILQGNISPWMLYCSKSGMDFLNNLFKEELIKLKPYIEPYVWERKLAINKKDVEYLKDLLEREKI